MRHFEIYQLLGKIVISQVDVRSSYNAELTSH